MGQIKLNSDVCEEEESVCVRACETLNATKA